MNLHALSHILIALFVVKRVFRIEEEQRLHQFLMGFNEAYSGVRRNILMSKSLPDVDTTYSMLINDESQLEAHTSSPSFHSDVVSFSTGVQRPYLSQYPPMQQNNYSQKVNLDNRRPNHNSNNSNSLFCRYCKKHSHVIANCRKCQCINSLNYNNGNNTNTHHSPTNTSSNQYRRIDACVQGLNTQVEMRSEVLIKSVQTDGKVTQLSPEQLTQMMSMMQHLKSACPDQASSDTIYAGLVSSSNFSNCSSFACHMSRVVDNPWIIDSGANNHMTPIKSFLTPITLLPVPYLITLPNGHMVKVTCTGTLTLSSELILQDVLFVPPLDII
ncbi:uncharacterized protein LOC132632833 [Lycium barbarum]|uniref:uncharacterized protein LOC132632833 n=1 Tax=Lycium barbarum TaxID=112863 RepID=UPI00293E57CA|nr:uncharacterized protein LOC132632833 [Lycium barbarum]